MTTARIILAALILLCGAYVAVMNWACVVMSTRNMRKGIDRHYSTIPVVSLLLAALAFPIWPHSPRFWIAAIPLCDIANWALLSVPFLILKDRRKAKEAKPDA